MRWCRVSAAFVLTGTLSAFALQARAAVLITVDKASQQMSVIVDGERRWTWPVSTGLSKYDTPKGAYTTFRMARDHRSREWDDAPMPHSIFFTRAGHAIHGSYAVRRLGRPASHGCVRLAPRNAAQLFALVRQHGLANTQVVIAGELPSALPRIAIPLPRERRVALRTIAPPETPAASGAKPSPAVAAVRQPEVSAQEHRASNRTIPLPRERVANRTSLPEPGASVVAERETPIAALPESGPAVVAASAPSDLRAKEIRVSADAVASPRPERAAQVPNNPVAAEREVPAAANAEPGMTVPATHPPEVVAVERRAPADALPLRQHERETREPERAVVAARAATPAAHAEPGTIVVATGSPDVIAVERRLPAEAVPLPRERRAALRAAVEPTDRPALREPPRQRSARERPTVYKRRSTEFGPRIYYNPGAEIVEETYVNGQWIRRRYYRAAPPRDFYGYR